MDYRLVFSEHYRKREHHFLLHHPELQHQYAKALALLQANPHHPSLRLHEISGERHGLHSAAINLSYRIALELDSHEHTITPVDVGDHDDVYHGDSP